MTPRTDFQLFGSNPLVVGDHVVDIDFDDGWLWNSFDIKITDGHHHVYSSIKGDIKVGPPHHQYSLNREITLWDRLSSAQRGHDEWDDSFSSDENNNQLWERCRKTLGEQGFSNSSESHGQYHDAVNWLKSRFPEWSSNHVHEHPSDVISMPLVISDNTPGHELHADAPHGLSAIIESWFQRPINMPNTILDDYVYSILKISLDLSVDIFTLPFQV